MVAVAALLATCGRDGPTPGSAASSTSGVTATTAPPPTTSPLDTTTTSSTTTSAPATTTTVITTTTTTTATTLPAAEPAAGCFLLDDATDALYVISDAGVETEVGRVLDATGSPPRNGTGAIGQLEALAHHPETGVLYTTSSGLLGTIDPETAVFSPLTKTGVDDLDGLAFDSDSELYAVSRIVDGPDRLVIIDLDRGRIADVGPIAGAGVPLDIDDIAFDPATGRLYAVANVEHEDPDETIPSVLVTVDPSTGAALVVGTDLGALDVEGLGFGAGGRLWATTGKRSRSALLLVDRVNGTAEAVMPLGPTSGDYEGVTCPAR